MNNHDVDPIERLYPMFQAGYYRTYDIGQHDIETKCRASFEAVVAQHDEWTAGRRTDDPPQVSDGNPIGGGKGEAA